MTDRIDTSKSHVYLPEGSGECNCILGTIDAVDMPNLLRHIRASEENRRELEELILLSLRARDSLLR